MIQPSIQRLQTLQQAGDHRPTQLRLQLKIPHHYRNDPILSTLAHQYQLHINILTALLAANAGESGWFDLELQGAPAHLTDALLHINDLGIEVLTREVEEDWNW